MIVVQNVTFWSQIVFLFIFLYLPAEDLQDSPYPDAKNFSLYSLLLFAIVPRVLCCCAHMH